MAADAPLKPVERLSAGELTLEQAAKDPAFKSLTIAAAVEACKDRGRRQVAVILRRAGLRPDLQFRHMREFQLERLLLAVAGKEWKGEWPQETTPLLHPPGGQMDDRN
jgi:hypothetical protein